MLVSWSTSLFISSKGSSVQIQNYNGYTFLKSNSTCEMVKKSALLKYIQRVYDCGTTFVQMLWLDKFPFFTLKMLKLYKVYLNPRLNKQILVRIY